MEPLKQQIIKHASSETHEPRSARLLIVADEAICPGDVVALLQQRHQCRRVHNLADAQHALAAAPFDIVLVNPQLPDGEGLGLAATVQTQCPATKIIVISTQHGANAAIEAMRCGAIDYLRAPAKAAEVATRVDAALERSRVDREREQRLVRLKNVCKQLNIARHEISEQIDLLCHDLVAAYREMSTQVNDAAMASEFRTLIRQELDVEDLLRTALEYTLTKTGPTNAAVFLPDGATRYALGAYVNYDCPRETIDVMLDRLGHAVCPQMAHESRIVSFDDPGDFAQWIGMDAGMLGESQVTAFSCTHENDCLAVIVLFRSRSVPFGEDLLSIVQTLRPIFAEQLARIIKVHHRSRPEWPNEATDDADDWDYNDDSGLGFGDLAA